MRTTARRALALAVAVPALAGSLVATAPAAHAAAPVCPAGTEVVEFDLLGDGHYRVAVYTPSATLTVLCLQLDTTTQAVVAVSSAAGVTPPKVTQTAGTGACATRIIDMTAPVDLSLSVGATTSRTICFGKDGVTTTVSLSSASVNALPDVDVWLPYGTRLHNDFCYYGWYVPYMVTKNPADLARYEECGSGDARVV